MNKKIIKVFCVFMLMLTSCSSKKQEELRNEVLEQSIVEVKDIINQADLNDIIKYDVSGENKEIYNDTLTGYITVNLIYSDDNCIKNDGNKIVGLIRKLRQYGFENSVKISEEGILKDYDGITVSVNINGKDVSNTTLDVKYDYFYYSAKNEDGKIDRNVFYVDSFEDKVNDLDIIGPWVLKSGIFPFDYINFKENHTFDVFQSWRITDKNLLVLSFWDEHKIEMRILVDGNTMIGVVTNSTKINDNQYCAKIGEIVLFEF